MKTKEEIEAIQSEVEALDKKLAELTEDELDQVTGGWKWPEGLGEGELFGNGFFARMKKFYENALRRRETAAEENKDERFGLRSTAKKDSTPWDV